MELPVLLAPLQGEVIRYGAEFEFQWSSAGAGFAYVVEVKKDGQRVVQSSRLNEIYWLAPVLPIGKYTWQVEAFAASAQGRWSPPSAFAISTTPGQPDLIDPPNGSTLAAGSVVTLTWSTGLEADDYFVELWTPTGVVRPTSHFTETTWTVGALTAGAYLWQVEAYNNLGWSGWTTPFQFMIWDNPQKPTLYEPIDGSIWNPDDEIWLTWMADEAAASYEIEILLNGQSVQPSGTVSEHSWYLGPVRPGEYSWRVQSRNPIAQSEWSSWSTFSVHSTEDLYLPLVVD
jgi:hypothetical protein